MNLFSFDSPFMSFLGKAVEYMLVSLLCLLFCIPVVTIGAAFTAQYYVGMKLVRGEDTPFFRAYINSFKENFAQATKIWLVELAIGSFLAYDWYLIYSNGGASYNQVFMILLIVVTLYFVMTSISIFALIARFEMTTKEAVKGAVVYTYVNIPRLIFIIVLTVFPTVAAIKHFEWLVAIWPVGSAACLYIISYNFAKSFKKLELRVQGVDDEMEAKADEDTTFQEANDSGKEK